MAELEDLLVDRGELDKELLAEVLGPYIGIDPVRMEIVPRDGWRSLNPEKKILIVLLGRRAMAAMPDLDIDGDSLTSKELQEATGLKGGTLRPTLTRMKEKGLVLQDKEKRYHVPLTAILSAKAVIEGGNNGQSSAPKRVTRRRSASKRTS